jgi:hypothetical protein
MVATITATTAITTTITTTTTAITTTSALWQVTVSAMMQHTENIATNNKPTAKQSLNIHVVFGVFGKVVLCVVLLLAAMLFDCLLVALFMAGDSDSDDATITSWLQQ